jgi:hypothetical protein
MSTSNFALLSLGLTTWLFGAPIDGVDRLKGLKITAAVEKAAVVQLTHERGGKFVAFTIQNKGSSPLKISTTVELKAGSEWREVYSDAFFSRFSQQGVSCYRIEPGGRIGGRFDADLLLKRQNTSKITVRAVVYEHSVKPNLPERIGSSEEIVVEK